MQIQATAKYIRISPRKVRLVADMVRGLSVSKAEPILKFSTKHAAEPIWKAVASAAANAKSRFDLTPEQLKIAQIMVDGAFVMKRFKARAFGRAADIKKRTSHISVILEPLTAAAEKKDAAKTAAPKRQAGLKRSTKQFAARGASEMTKKS